MVKANEPMSDDLIKVESISITRVELRDPQREKQPWPCQSGKASMQLTHDRPRPDSKRPHTETSRGSENVHS